MRARTATVIVLACGLGLALAVGACNDRQPTSPADGPEATGEVAASQAGNAEVEGEIGRLVAAIYPPGQLKRDANKTFSDIKSAMARGDTDGARRQMVAYVDALIEQVRAGELQDPLASQAVPSTTEDAAAELIRAYHQLVGLEPPAITGGIFEESGAAAVVSPDEETQVKTGNGKGAVNIPSSAFDEPAFVALDRRETPPSQARAPVPPTLDLAVHPPFYNVETTTQPAGNGDGVLVGICVPESGPLAPLQDLQDDLRVVRKADGSSSPEVLPTADAGFVDCGADEIAVAGKTTGFSTFGGSSSLQAIQTAAGREFSCALREDGQTFCWGENLAGELGDGTTAPDSTPVAVDQSVDGGVAFDSITAGYRYACARTSGGDAYCWGSNFFGQLGDGTETDRTTPVAVQTTVDFVQINAGSSTTCALDGNGQAYCWGHGGNGQIGDGSFSSTTTPTAVDQSGGLTFEEVRAGHRTSCGLTSSGQAYCWGADLSYAPVLGTGAHFGSATPVPVDQSVDGGVSFTGLTTGIWNNCALASDGQAYCWGANFRSLLGISPGCTDTFSCTPAKSEVPAAVDQSADGGVSFVQVEGSYQQHNCGLTSGGQAYCWSLNLGGQLGDGSSGNQRPVPVAVDQSVDGGVLFDQLSAGYYHTCAVATNGEVYCWGENTTGSVGDGTTVMRTTPVKVGG